MRILNLYSGIGGNRKLWGDNHEITSVELDPEIADIYKGFFPNDNVIVGDAHDYLINNYQNFDFIWSSPPCPTHSRFQNLKMNSPETVKKYPDMKLYEEVIYLKHFFKKAKWVVENVISYYDPLIKPTKSNNHYFWSNFDIPILEKDDRGIRGTKDNFEHKQKRLGFIVEDLPITSLKKRKILNNCVLPQVGLAILQSALEEDIEVEKKQDALF